MNQPLYAHSQPGRPVEEWQPLDEHLRAVAEMAKKFADLSCIVSATQEPFGSGDWAYLAGLWHDLGKEKN